MSLPKFQFFGRLALLATIGATPALAQPARPVPAARPATPPPPASPTTAIPAPTQPATGAAATEPQRTTASFDDWIVRCERRSPTVQLCEAAQIFNNAQSQPVAQLALGHAVATDPLHLTMLVPPNVALTVAPKLLAGETDKATTLIELTWRRCLPGGCIADAIPSPDVLKQFRAGVGPFHITYQNAVGAEGNLTISSRGLNQALEGLAKEETR